MKNTITYLGFLVFAGMLSMTGYPSGARGMPSLDDRDRDMSRGKVANFDEFLDSHPELSEQLQKNPSLINNDKYLEDHPALKMYLVHHPEVREDFKENPGAFMKAERRYDATEREDRDRRDGDGSQITRGSVGRFDGFLDSHPQIEKDLAANPGRINNSDYLNDHPELREFLKTHPEVRDQFRDNPRGFMSAEKSFDKHEPPARKPSKKK